MPASVRTLSRHVAARTGAACALVLAIVGCAGGSSDPVPAAGAPSSSPATAAGGTPASTATTGTKTLSAAAAQWLDLDLASPANYAAAPLPAHYLGTAVRALDNTPGNDPVSDRVAVLGRVLFNDPRLSVDDSVSCASCHRQAAGFDDPARFSTGFGGGLTTAHAMRLGNLRYFAPGTMFWDKRAASLEAQSTQPIQHPAEMGFDASRGGMPAVLAKMAALPYYPELFDYAFGDATITEARIQRALAHFVRSMVSTGSAWDAGYALAFDPALPDRGLGTPIGGFSAAQERGRQLFLLPPQQGGLGCAGCHVPPSFALAANALGNGLDAGESRVFKSPSLKNVALSQAFMHDGRFATLAQVIDHYDSGVRDGPALDPRLRGAGGDGPPRRLNLSASDKAALVAFLGTLTDTAFVSDPKFSSPFKR